jgi:hypothetical protein
MNILILFAIIAGISFIGFIVYTIRIISFLQSRKIKINWFLFRILIYKYVNQYKTIMLKEIGEVGPLYRSWSLSLFAMIAFSAAAILAKIAA